MNITQGEQMYELRRSVFRPGPPELAVIKDDLSTSAKGYNFRSVFGYPAEVVERITNNGHTKGLKGLPVYSRTLFLDADTDESAIACERKLKELKISFMVFDTGNRGLHFHVPIVEMAGTDVIHSQTTWLKNNDLWEVLDTSIFREGGQYRLEGATHQKTGRTKTRLREYPGVILEIPTVKTPAFTRRSEPRTTVPEDLPKERQDYFLNLTTPRDEGRRTPHFYILWRQGVRAGLEQEEILEDILWFNNHYCFPAHPDDYVIRKVGGFS